MPKPVLMVSVGKDQQARAANALLEFEPNSKPAVHAALPGHFLRIRRLL
jgi:hypothetical protein